MKYISHFLSIVLFITSCSISQKEQQDSQKYILVIHGGAGSVKPKDLTEKEILRYKLTLRSALEHGYKLWKKDKSSMDVVEETIIILENSPLFNAGKGAVFASNGKNELDAAIMDGSTLNAGSVAGLTTIKNPITAARKVIEHTWHVMLAGNAADKFATKFGCESIHPDYFKTEKSWQEYLKTKEKNQATQQQKKYGTVGAVCLDSKNKLAAGTSTGGLAYKQYGRIGDVPIIGGGTYANKEVAISCTGQGEYFMRLVFAKSLADRMEIGNSSVEEASKVMINKVQNLGGKGGVIAISRDGKIAMEYNTHNMFRGSVSASGKIEVAIF